MAYAIVAVLILILDQAVKYWTTVNIPLGETSPIIPGFIEFTNIHNTGAAYGILDGARWLFIVLTLAFVVAIIVMLSKNVIKGKFGRWTIVMVMAGGIGNCIDRISHVYVVDMFNFQFTEYPVFNVADMFISVCGVLFCLYIIFHKNPKPKENDDVPEPSVPRTRERPVKGPDYMAQLQKPVADAKLELYTPSQETAPVRSNKNGSFEEWNTPMEFKNPTQSPAPIPAKVKISAQPVPPEIQTQPVQPKKKSDDEFSLDSILEEFKDQ